MATAWLSRHGGGSPDGLFLVRTKARRHKGGSAAKPLRLFTRDGMKGAAHLFAPAPSCLCAFVPLCEPILFGWSELGPRNCYAAVVMKLVPGTIFHGRRTML